MSATHDDDAVALYVSVPVACFRAPQAREYLETLPVPPPSTVYGMLLSLVGETNRLVHVGAEVAVAVLGEGDPARSTVLRTVWRVKSQALPPGTGANARPDYQEVLTGVRLVVWCRQGMAEVATPTLAARVAATLADPGGTSRFGGLSLGESSHLVDEIRAYRSTDGQTARMLVRRSPGAIALPVWVDHVGSARTVWGQFDLDRINGASLDHAPIDDAWVAIVREASMR